VENSRQMGERLRAGLDSLLTHPVVGEVRSLGLLAGVELVLDRKTKTSITDDDARLLTRYLKDEGVLTRVNTVLCLAPPLCITLAEVDWLIAVIDRVLGKFEKERGLV
jgi:4-aminobutyrate--pyruvate transaminase